MFTLHNNFESKLNDVWKKYFSSKFLNYVKTKCLIVVEIIFMNHKKRFPKERCKTKSNNIQTKQCLILFICIQYTYLESILPCFTMIKMHPSLFSLSFYQRNSDSKRQRDVTVVPTSSVCNHDNGSHQYLITN